MFDYAGWSPTYSGPWLDRLGRIALLFYVLGQWNRWNPPLILALLVQASLWTETALLSVTAHPETKTKNKKSIAQKRQIHFFKLEEGTKKTRFFLKMSLIIPECV